MSEMSFVFEAGLRNCPSAFEVSNCDKREREPMYEQ
jgi:hypothetical protein